MNHWEAVKWYEKAAKKGNADAQCSLGYCHESGRGVEKDLAKAAEWYREAAEQGDMRGHSAISAIFMRAEEVLKKTLPRQRSGTANLRSRDMHGRKAILATAMGVVGV